MQAFQPFVISDHAGKCPDCPADGFPGTAAGIVTGLSISCLQCLRDAFRMGQLPVLLLQLLILPWAKGRILDLLYLKLASCAASMVSSSHSLRRDWYSA